MTQISFGSTIMQPNSVLIFNAPCCGTAIRSVVNELLELIKN